MENWKSLEHPTTAEIVRVSAKALADRCIRREVFAPLRPTDVPSHVYPTLSQNNDWGAKNGLANQWLSIVLASDLDGAAVGRDLSQGLLISRMVSDNPAWGTDVGLAVQGIGSTIYETVVKFTQNTIGEHLAAINAGALSIYNEEMEASNDHEAA